MNNVYISPFTDRYASKEMLYNFSADKKFKTWRQLWIALAEKEKELGLPITDVQIAELKDHQNDINYDVARQYEEKLKHDVMAHIKAYGDQCPNAKGIIHLGATSAYVVDNTDLILIKDGYDIILNKLSDIISKLTLFAKQYADLPTVAYTHFQPAQFTTVGKRACLWIHDLLLDFDDITHRYTNLKFLGVKGTTGTQASFMALFDNDQHKVTKLDRSIAYNMGFNGTYSVSGQTYSRKIDAQVHSVLSGIAESAHKFSNDLRLLQHLGEIQEPFGKDQVGSSAMAYKRNPMKSERIASLSRFVLSLQSNADFTAASQWFERTLDDSAGKRIALPEAFLAVDSILQIYLNIVSGLVVNKDVIGNNVRKELPSIVTENVLMAAVKIGGDRQELHERIRQYMLSGKDLIQCLKNDDVFSKVSNSIKEDPINYVGRSQEQVDEFIDNEVKSRLEVISNTCECPSII